MAPAGGSSDLGCRAGSTLREGNMRFNRNLKRSLILGAATALMAGTVAAALVVRTNASHAASSTSAASFTGTFGTLGRVSTSSTLPHGLQPNLDAIACM